MAAKINITEKEIFLIDLKHHKDFAFAIAWYELTLSRTIRQI